MIEIEVFGIRDEEPIGVCSCGGSCGSSSQKTMGEMFEELRVCFNGGISNSRI